MLTDDDFKRKYGISLEEARQLLPNWGNTKTDEQITRLLDFITTLCEKTINNIMGIGEKV
jgi:hypothetical protein